MSSSADSYALVPVRHPSSDDAMPGAVIDLRGIFRTFGRHRAWILLPVLLCGGIALAVALSLSPRYEAGAKVLLDPRGIQILQNDLRPNNPTGDETGAEVDSQVQVVASTNLLRRVAERLGLATDPEFVDPPPSLMTRLAKAVQGLFVDQQAAVPEAPLQRALRTLQEAVAVRRAEKTFVIDIAVRTSDPDKSARIANAVAEAFVRDTSDVRADAARRSGSELSARLEQLRGRVQRSEAAVEQYRKQSDLISANGRLVTEQQLAELNGQLTLARTRSADQQARIAEVQRMASGGKSADAMAEVSISPTMIALRSQYTEAARAEAEARMNFGPRHPAMQNAEKQVQTIRQRISEEVARLSRTAQSDYERARSSESTITRRIEALKRDSTASNEAQVRLRELERQASADRSVYESFLNRAKDLDERQALDNGNARIITQAVAPLGRTGLSRVLIVAGGLAFGAVMGLGLALLRGQSDDAPRPNPQLGARPQPPVLTVTSSETAGGAAAQRVHRLLTPAARSGPARLVVVAGLGAAGARARLAQVLALHSNSEGERTLLIDGDFEARTLTRLLHAHEDTGFTDALAMLPEALMPTPRSFNGLQVITAGTRDAGTVTVNVRTLRQALDPYLRRTGLIIIDGGSIGPNLNGFAALADDILIVVEGGRTVQRNVRDALDALAFNVDCIRGILIAGETEA